MDSNCFAIYFKDHSAVVMSVQISIYRYKLEMNVKSDNIAFFIKLTSSYTNVFVNGIKLVLKILKFKIRIFIY